MKEIIFLVIISILCFIISYFIGRFHHLYIDRKLKRGRHKIIKRPRKTIPNHLMFSISTLDNIDASGSFHYHPFLIDNRHYRKKIVNVKDEKKFLPVTFKQPINSVDNDKLTFSDINNMMVEDMKKFINEKKDKSIYDRDEIEMMKHLFKNTIIGVREPSNDFINFKSSNEDNPGKGHLSFKIKGIFDNHLDVNNTNNNNYDDGNDNDRNDRNDNE